MLESVKKLLSGWFKRGPAGGVAVSVAPALAAEGRERADHRRIFSDGVSHYRAGRYEAAAACFERVVELAHDHAEAHLNLGLAYQKLSRYEDAADCFVMALSFSPDYPQAHFNLGVLALERGLFDDAVAGFEKAISLKPDYVEALSNLGYVQFRYQGQLSEGENSLRRAISINSDFLDAHCNLGMLWERQGRFDEAEKKYEEILTRDPSFNEARLNSALLLLAKGDFERGWTEYEVRKKGGTHFNSRNFPYPDWDGTTAPGKTILVYGEQGLGDEIMFASCLPDLMARRLRCVIDCSTKLERIFRRSFPSATVHGGAQLNTDLSWLSSCPLIDYQAAIGSLPLHFRRSWSDFPRHSGYLKADTKKVEAWAERLCQLGSGLKIGISWRGGTQYTNQTIRSLSLDELLPVLGVENMQFVSLQYTECATEIAALRERHGIIVHHWQEAIDDYDELSALVAALDLIISVQTAVVHLTGALGKPGWVMVPVVPEWRYQRSGETLPWYPSLRLFRQRALGQWQDVIDRVAAELRQTLMTVPLRNSSEL